jgi:hypothetical protein
MPISAAIRGLFETIGSLIYGHSLSHLLGLHGAEFPLHVSAAKGTSRQPRSTERVFCTSGKTLRESLVIAEYSCEDTHLALEVQYVRERIRVVIEQLGCSVAFSLRLGVRWTK